MRDAARAAAAALAALALGACASHGGHYYADDGPPEHVPAGIAETPDAVPRIEAVSPNANRPYSALGRTYTPDTSDTPFEQRGLASWYGKRYHGGHTSSGETYDMFAMSAAHPTLPIPSYARVTSVRDGRSVVVRINDRGPFLENRIIDLSYAAAARLGIVGAGSGEVLVHKITASEIAAGAPPPAAAARTAVVAASAAPAVAGEVAAAPAPAVAQLLPGPARPAELVGAAPTAGAAPPAATALASAPAAPPAAADRPWSVQLGAFAVASNAQALRDSVAARLAAPDAAPLPADAKIVRIERTGRLSRVLVGEAIDRRAAQALALALGRLLARETSLYLRP